MPWFQMTTSPFALQVAKQQSKFASGGIAIDPGVKQVLSIHAGVDTFLSRPVS